MWINCVRKKTCIIFINFRDEKRQVVNNIRITFINVIIFKLWFCHFYYNNIFLTEIHCLHASEVATNTSLGQNKLGTSKNPFAIKLWTALRAFWPHFVSTVENKHCSHSCRPQQIMSTLSSMVNEVSFDMNAFHRIL